MCFGCNGTTVPFRRGARGETNVAGSVLEIFSNAEEVLAFNEQVLLDLASRDGGLVGGRRRSIGATFRRQPLDMFKPYSEYVNQYPQALKRYKGVRHRARTINDVETTANELALVLCRSRILTRPRTKL